MTKRGFAIVSTVAVMYLLVFAVAACFGDAPDCEGNRHYDECGDYCPMPTTTTTTVDPPATTTTTLDESGCAPCPVVECRNGVITNNTTITVNRCPAMPAYKPCRVIRGKLHCPKPNYHGRLLVPVVN
jgi:hypothetical protein